MFQRNRQLWARVNNLSAKKERNCTFAGTSSCGETSGDEQSWSTVSLQNLRTSFGMIFVVWLAVRGYFVRSPFDLRDQNSECLSKKFLNFGNSTTFLGCGCCYGYCDQFCDWWI